MSKRQARSIAWAGYALLLGDDTTQAETLDVSTLSRHQDDAEAALVSRNIRLAKDRLRTRRYTRVVRVTILIEQGDRP